MQHKQAFNSITLHKVSIWKYIWKYLETNSSLKLFSICISTSLFRLCYRIIE